MRNARYVRGACADYQRKNRKPELLTPNHFRLMPLNGIDQHSTMTPMLTPSDSEASFVLLAEDQTLSSDLSSSPGQGNSATQHPVSDLRVFLGLSLVFTYIIQITHPSNEATYSVGSSGTFAHDWSRKAPGGPLRA
jgi:hypothetical protein